MKQVSIIILCLFCSTLVSAQKKSNKDTFQQKPKHKPVPTFLGFSEWRNGLIAKKSFDSLASQGLTAKDSSGKVGKVLQFSLYYKEHNLYEDSVGNYYVGTDIITDFSKSNKLNTYLGTSLTDRTKRGDTAIFDDILVLMPDSTVVMGLPMVFAIGK